MTYYHQAQGDLLSPSISVTAGVPSAITEVIPAGWLPVPVLISANVGSNVSALNGYVGPVGTEQLRYTWDSLAGELDTQDSRNRRGLLHLPAGTRFAVSVLRSNSATAQYKFYIESLPLGWPQ